MLKNPEFWFPRAAAALVQSYNLTFRYAWSVTKGKASTNIQLCLHTVKRDTAQTMAFHLQRLYSQVQVASIDGVQENTSPEDDHLGTNKD